ncbi:MAG: PEP-CTERM sorting domain-containing protein [Planctomycetota bacterium]
MKKFLILLLVLGMTSMASATIILKADISGTPYDLSGSGLALTVGTPVHVIVEQDAENSTGSGGEMIVTMSASGLTMTDTTPQFNTIPYAGWDWFFNGGVSPIDNSDGTYDAWFSKVGNINSAFGMNGTPGIGSWVGYSTYGWAYVSTVEFTFVASATTNLVWSGTWDGADMDGLNGGTVNVIPEPMTIALLGLGGLFLRRRK